MIAQVPILCDPPEALTNGDFEDIGSCSSGSNCNVFAFNTNGCGIPDWIAGVGSPDLCQEFDPGESYPTITAFSGTWFAKMHSSADYPQCYTEGIVQTLDLVEGYRYELSFHHRTTILNGTGVDVYIYLVSGFTNISSISTGTCPTPAQSWTLVGSVSNFISEDDWEATTAPFSFLATDTDQQLFFYPVAKGSGTGLSAIWYVDDIQIEQCVSALTPSFDAEIVDGTTYQFNDQTPGTVTDWCWDFGDGNYSTDQNPEHEYSSPGTYTVCLTILDEDGCVNTACYEIGEACECSEVAFTLSTNTTWSSQTVNISGNLIIPPGKTLTINASTVQIATGCGITVSRGARLNILPGSTLKAWCENGLWKGILVNGNGFMLHPAVTSVTTGTYPIGNVLQHGVVYALGNPPEDPTTIRDARIAIGNPANSFFGAEQGGIIYAQAVTFTENQVSGDIQRFPSQIGTGTSPAFMPNISRFIDCTFDLDTGNPPNIPTANGIRIVASNGVVVRGCTFADLGNDAITGTNYTATIQGCTFEGVIPAAIRVQHTANLPIPFQYIVGGGENGGNTFNNIALGPFSIPAGIGVSASNVMDLLVSHNTFDNNFIGINIFGPSGYLVSNNIFNENDESLAGVLLNQTVGNFLNETMCNQYFDLSFASQAAWGNNAGHHFVQETFNEDAGKAVILSPFTVSGQNTPGEISASQGEQGAAVYNSFLNEDHIISSTTSGQTAFFWYFYPDDDAQTFPELLPNCDLNDGCLGGPNNYLAKETDSGEDSDGCLDLEGVGGEEEPEVAELPDSERQLRIPLTPNIPDMATTPGDPVFSGLTCDTTNCLDTIRWKIGDLKLLTDGGDTENLLGKIDNYPNETTTLNELLGVSPYLSDEVLIAMMNSAMDTSWMKTVLAANAPVGNSVIEAAGGTLSVATIQMLTDQRITLIISDMEQKQNLTDRLYRIKHTLMADFLKMYYREADYEAIEAMLVEDATHFADRMLLGLKLQLRAFEDAQDIINECPSGIQDETDYKYLQQINLYRLADSTFVLSNGQEDTLYMVANGITTQAAVAKTLLTILTDTIFPVEAPGYMSPRESNDNAGRVKPEQPGQLLVFPNPASGEVKVLLPKGMQKATIWLYDINGKVLQRYDTIDTEVFLRVGALSEGLYFIRAEDGVNGYNTKIVIQR